ncbi:MAG: hypothetical protein IKL00_09115 [Oscillospiraceae bacterium]|nr:hypothetical protein [Oscillospiraceae bacterium]
MKIQRITAAITAFSLFLTGGMQVCAESTVPNWQYDTNAWAILNVKEHMGETYMLLDEDQEKLEAVLKNTEKYGNERLGDTFRGACYGFAATSVLSSYGLIPCEEYALNDDVIPTRLSDIGLPYISDTAQAMDVVAPDKAVSLINYYMRMQITDTHRQLSAWQMYTYTEEERVQELLRLTEQGVPVVTSFFYFKGEKENGRTGHAVVAYAVEECDFEWDYKHYDKKICLYDPNGPQKIADDGLKEGLERLDQIYVNTEDYSWVLPLYNVFSEDGANLTSLCADVNLLNEGGILSGTEPYTSDQPFIGVMTTNWLENGYTLHKAETANDVLTPTGTANFKATDNFYPDCVASAIQNFLTQDVQDAYILELEMPQELEAFMYYEDSIQRVQADSTFRVAVSPDGFSEMSGDNTAYTFEMVWNEGFYTGSWYDFTVSGNADTASLRKTEDGYILKSDNLQNVTVTAKNNTAQANLTFSTDADSVLLCEENESTIAAKIDTDGDGVYETELSAEPEPFVYGDMNGDGSVNALDAALILQYAAYAGAGGELSFEEYVKK